jgi:hypothetical protein
VLSSAAAVRAAACCVLAAATCSVANYLMRIEKRIEEAALKLGAGEAATGESATGDADDRVAQPLVAADDSVHDARHDAHDREAWRCDAGARSMTMSATAEEDDDMDREELHTEVSAHTARLATHPTHLETAAPPTASPSNGGGIQAGADLAGAAEASMEMDQGRRGRQRASPKRVSMSPTMSRASDALRAVATESLAALESAARLRQHEAWRREHAAAIKALLTGVDPFFVDGGGHIRLRDQHIDIAARYLYLPAYAFVLFAYFQL